MRAPAPAPSRDASERARRDVATRPGRTCVNVTTRCFFEIRFHVNCSSCFN